MRTRVVIKEPWKKPRLGEVDCIEKMIDIIGKHEMSVLPMILEFEAPIYVMIDERSKAGLNFYNKKTADVVSGTAVFFTAINQGQELREMTDAQIARVIRRFELMEDQEERAP